MSDKKVETESKRGGKKPALGRGLHSLLGANSLMDTEEIEIDINDNEPIEIVPFKSSPLAGEKFIETPAAPQTPKTRPVVNRNEVLGVAAATAPASSAGPSSSPTIADTARVWQVAIDKVSGNPGQPRKSFEETELRELANSIREKGILQPIVCRKIGSAFEIIAGERRWRAAQLAGLHEVPVILKETDDQNTLELALIENIQRADLNPIEEAEAYQQLMQRYGLTQQSVADRLGKDRVTVANMLRLLQLDRDVREWVIKNEISLGQAKVLLAIKDLEAQRAIARIVRDKKLSVRATEKLVQTRLREGELAAQRLAEVDISEKLVQGVAQELQKILGTKVQIDYAKGKGRIGIQFYSDAELNQIIERFRSAWQK